VDHARPRAAQTLPVSTRSDGYLSPGVAADPSRAMVAVEHRTGLRVYACDPGRGEARLALRRLAGAPRRGGNP
jgi:hypothetical protein